MAKNPKEAANLGRSRLVKLRSDWESAKDEVMYRAIQRKFLTHQDLREKLLNTGDEPLIENSPIDYYWGCGKDGTGRNMSGVILMRVRGELRR